MDHSDGGMGHCVEILREIPVADAHLIRAELPRDFAVALRGWLDEHGLEALGQVGEEVISDLPEPDWLRLVRKDAVSVIQEAIPPSTRWHLFKAAIRHRRIDVVKWVIGKLSVPWQASALHYAAECGALQGIHVILESGVPVDAPDIHGSTALMVASGRGQVEAVEMLMSCGADPNAQNRYGGDATVWATNSGAARSAEVLRRLKTGNET